MGPERLLDFAARQLQTDANRWPPQGAIEAKLPQSGLKMRHPKGIVPNLRFMTQITPLKKSSRKPKIAFQRDEMSLILDVYGRLVMSGQAKDYAVGAHKDQAVFAIFRRHAETPNWTVVKTPALARMQGAYSVHGAQGQTLKRGRDLKQVLTVFETRKFEIVR